MFVRVGKFFLGLLIIKYDSTQGVSLSGCLFINIPNKGKNNDSETHFIDHSHTFCIIQLEPGLGGGKFEVGIGYLYMTSIMSKLSLLRTWKDTLNANPNQTYLGAEFEVAAGIGGIGCPPLALQACDPQNSWI